ncbi:tail fiber protein [Bacillus phage vB_BauM_KLEB27-3]|nr:tail fiber protein [Bacillus phage vB_BauM_KLEB27-3]
MSASKFPEELDRFQPKNNAEFEGDPQGDYVMAEDVNELQDAIHAIEKTLGVNPQGGSGSVGERISLFEGSSSVKVPSFLMYLGELININDSETVNEASSILSLFNHVVIGEESINEMNQNKEILTETKKKSNTSFYGLIDVGVLTANTSVTDIQNKIFQFREMGVEGIYCKNFGYENEVSRDRQNKILESIHQYGMVAILTGDNPEELFTEVYHESLNPDWIDPLIEAGDAYHIERFAVDSSIYTLASVDAERMNKLYEYRKDLGIKIFGSGTVLSTSSQSDAQERYEYAEGSAVLYSLDAYYIMVEGYGEISRKIWDFKWMPLIGSWYESNPVIIEDNGQFKRKTSFGDITLIEDRKKVLFEGLYIPSEMMKFNPNSINGNIIMDSTIDETKIKKYSGNKLINAINEDQTTNKIKITKVEKFSYDDLDGSVPVDHLSANVINAINAYIGSAVIGAAKIGDLNAEKITTGSLKADIIKSSVVDAINIYAQNMTADSAKIDVATIGELTADHIKANIVEAINLYAENMDVNSAHINTAVIKELSANKITSGDIASDRMRANVVNAINLYAETIVGDSARIDTAVIGELTADHIKASVIDAINASIETATIDGAKITAATIDGAKIKEATITGANIALATIDTANIKDLAVGTAQIDLGSITSALIAEAAVESIHIAEATITDAHVLELNANKIKAGSIDTTRVTIQGDNGHLKLSGNRLQVFDDSEPAIERVSVGDVDNDGSTYGLRVRGSDGQTVLYDENGVYTEGITDGAVTNPKIGDEAVDSRVIMADAILAKHISADTIVARHIASDSITTRHILAGSITADSAIIAEAAIKSINIGEGQISNVHIQNAAIKSVNIEDGAITTVKIGDAEITAAKIKDLAITNAKIADATIEAAKIKNINADVIDSGTILAKFIQVGRESSFEDGYDPKFNDDQVRLDLRLEAPLPSRIKMNENGIRVDTDIADSYASLDYRGLYIKGGAIVIDGGLPSDQLDPDLINDVNNSLKSDISYNGVQIDGTNGIQVNSLKNLLSMNATDGIKLVKKDGNEVIFGVTPDGDLTLVGNVDITGGSISWSNVAKPSYTAGEVGAYTKAEFDEKISFYATTEDVEAALDLQADQIKLEVSQNLRDTLVVGGRNLAMNSAFIKGLDKWRNWQTTSDIRRLATKEEMAGKAGFDTGVYIETSVKGQFGYAQDNILVDQGEWYVASLYYKILSSSGNIMLQQGSGSTFTSSTATEVGQWKRLIHKFQASGSTTNIYIGQGSSDATPTIKALITGVKVEKASDFPTEWTPAPEDTDEVLKSVTDRLTNAESSLVLQADQIATKVSADELGMMEPGEVNIIENSSFAFGLWPLVSPSSNSWSINNGVTLFGRPSVEYSHNGSTSNYPAVGTDYIDARESNLVGQTVTMSVYLKVAQGATFNDIMYFELCGYENTSQTVNQTIARFSLTPAELNANVDVWKRYSFTTVIPETNGNGTVNYVRALLRLSTVTPTNKEHLYFALPKLELGSTPTNWMPHITDGWDQQDSIVRRQSPYKTRYIKLTALGPNTVNSAFHPVSLSAIVAGSDVARGILPTAGNAKSYTNLDRITNGNIDSANYASIDPINSDYGQWVQIDLGKVYENLERIDFIVYYIGNRRYRYKIEISEDGTTWKELYNSKKHGTYVAYMNGVSFLVNGSDKIRKLSTSITQTSQQISLKVSRDDVISSINQTPEQISIQAGKISLDGYVEAKHIKSLNGLNINDKFIVDNTGNVTFSGALSGATGTFSGSLNAATGTFTGNVTVKSGTNYVVINSGSLLAYNEAADWTSGRFRILGGELKFESPAGSTYYGRIVQEKGDSVIIFENYTGFSFQSRANGVMIDTGLSVTAPITCGNISLNGFNTIKNSGNTLYLEGNNGVVLNHTSGGRFELSTDATGQRVFSMAIYDRTYGNNSPNLYITSAGTLGRVTSAKKYKLLIQERKEKNDKNILNLKPKTWFDRGSCEVYADHLTKVDSGEAIIGEEGDIGGLERIPGLIAEDLIELGLNDFVSYERREDGKKEVEGLMYDRLWTLLLPIVKEHEETIALLKKEIEELKNQQKK